MKLAGVKSITSEVPSARTRVASKREEAEVRTVEKRILGERNVESMNCNQKGL